VDIFNAFDSTGNRAIAFELSIDEMKLIHRAPHVRTTTDPRVGAGLSIILVPAPQCVCLENLPQLSAIIVLSNSFKLLSKFLRIAGLMLRRSARQDPSQAPKPFTQHWVREDIQYRTVIEGATSKRNSAKAEMVRVH